MPEIGISGLIVILVVALLVFGPKRLPEIGHSLGKGMREFKDSITGSQQPDSPPERLSLEQSDEAQASTATDRTGGRFCTGCGAEARPDDRFCSSCGTSLDHSPEALAG
ncbi:MAG: twin-arginine translocase TatA/TatE family subunit [Gaiellaceae bacterium]